MHQFSCPHCSIRLRFRDNEYRNRTIACPECRQPVLVEEVQGTLRGKAVKARPEPVVDGPALEIPLRPLKSTSGLATWISLAIAGTLCLGLVIYSFSGEQDDGEKEKTSDVPAAAPLKVQAPAPAPSMEASKSTDDDTVEMRLKEIHNMISASARTHGRYPSEPAGTPTSLRSWIAELAETRLPPVPVHWDRGWAAPVNDEFVRRRFPAFENPAIETKVGEDHYPATHFVGVAGVGPDAAKLPKADPRAGIFGEGRSTQLQDIKDGLAQTIIIMGVENRLGSWARPGDASVRALTQVPYLHGPDGFGTGQAESMMVLMADGSVRTIDAKADPVIMRRMAAMADGLSLDPKDPGDPLMAGVPKIAPVEPPAPDPRPKVKSPEMHEVIDLRPRLQQPILEFSQPNATPLETILFEVQELIGMPIDISALSPEMRKTPVSVSLGAATVKDVLDHIIQQAGLTSEIQRDRIVIRPAPK